MSMFKDDPITVVYTRDEWNHVFTSVKLAQMMHVNHNPEVADKLRRILDKMSRALGVDGDPLSDLTFENLNDYELKQPTPMQ